MAKEKDKKEEVPSLLIGKSADSAGKRNYASYYSGTDIRIYFGDLWLDEILEIEWSLIEQVAPIYGYASRTYDRVARGNRIVQGSFALNFKEAGYLHVALDRLASKYVDGDIFNNTFQNKVLDAKEKVKEEAPKNLSVEKIIKNFDALANSYEQSLWGNESDLKTQTNNRTKDSFFYPIQTVEKNKQLRDHGFNILLTYGNSEDLSRGSSSFQTAQTIVGVQLTGLSQQVDPSGNPIREIYTFIAKDISGNIQKIY